VYGEAAEQAQRMLRCIVRGFVLQEVMDYFLDPASYEESYEKAILVFITGLPALASHEERTPDRGRIAA